MEMNSSYVLIVFPPCLLDNWGGVGEDEEAPGGSLRGSSAPSLAAATAAPELGRGDTAQGAPRPRAPEGLGETREEPSSSRWGLEPALPLWAVWLWARNRAPLSLTLLEWTIKMVVLCLS